MQVQSIGNKGLDVNFKSGINIEKASAFVNANDSELKSIAYVSSIDKKDDRKKAKSINRIFYSIPIIDTIASGVLVNRSKNLSKEAIAELRHSGLKTRLKAAGKTAGAWGGVIAAVTFFNLAKSALTSKSDKAKKFEHRNPLTSFALDLGVIFGGMALGERAINKLSSVAVKKNPKPFNAFHDFKTKIGKIVSESKLNTKVLPKVTEFVSKYADKFPKTATASRFALKNSMWILLGAGLIKMAHSAKEKRNKIERNYHQLKTAQFEVSKHLVNALGVERDVLAQDQKLMAKELRRQMNKTQPPEEMIETAEVIED